MVETWIKIEDSKYHISNKGLIKNFITGRILKPFIVKNDKHESFKIKLVIKGKRKTYAISRLVAIAFIPNPENKPEVDHKNRNPLDDRLENLRWVTRKENCKNRLMITEDTISKIICLNNEGKSSSEIYNLLK
jgi:hypothetical protein